MTSKCKINPVWAPATVTGVPPDVQGNITVYVLGEAINFYGAPPTVYYDNLYSCVNFRDK